MPEHTTPPTGQDTSPNDTPQRPRWGRLLLWGGVPVALLLSALVWWMAFAPNTPAYDDERAVYLPPGTGFETIIDSLESAGVLRSAFTFRAVGTATGWRRDVRAGHYRFESGASNVALLDALRKGHDAPIRVTIPPGTRPGIAAAVAAREMRFDPSTFQEALRDSALATSVGAPPGDLFPYLLPDTYHFDWLTPPRRVVENIVGTFDRWWADAHQTQADSLGLSQYEVLTLASIVEWETGVEEEKARVAGVYLNRLNRGMRLQADPTVQYALLEAEGQRRRLFFVDYDIDHPYNTYQIDGLPPGPLTNPSRSSIEAVLYPGAHDYLYFVASIDGGHTFSRTLREHNRAARAFHEAVRQQRR